jgi:hypothetical protein
MATGKCSSCQKEVDTEKLVETDEFKEYGSPVKVYCPDCFLKGAKIGFGNYEIDACDVCNENLILQFDEEETLSLAIHDYTVHYVCPKVKKAIEKEDENLINKLDEEGHNSLILYTIAPNPNEPDFG